MESQTQSMTKTTESTANISTEVGGMLTSTTTPSGAENWQEWVDVVLDFLAKVPDQLGTFFTDYKKPLTSLALIITAAITVYITLSVLDAIAHIPLLSPVLELVGLGYTIWFVTRYLLKASSREELFAEFNALKQQVVGEVVGNRSKDQ